MGIREKGFSMVVPQLWNSLSREATLAPSMAIFRQVLNTYILGRHFILLLNFDLNVISGFNCF